MTRIVQLTDLHVFADPSARLFGIPTRELLEDVVSHVEAHAGPVDHVVVTGDHTHDELPETYAAVRELLAPFLDRLWLLPGNHDDRAVLRA
ncbi:MAG: metallophosphoesterase, partial [Chloroflexi bacterium]|nr:metallophosphoesterase [Chloroflexota bacterium]